jgi:hypothetical protein
MMLPSVIDDFEDLFGVPAGAPPEDRVSPSISMEIKKALSDRSSAPSVTVFHDGTCKVLQTMPKWLGEHWGAAIIVDHSARKYALIIVPAPELIDNVRFDPVWVKFPHLWDRLMIDKAQTGRISHLDIAYFVPRGAIVSLSPYGILSDDYPCSNLIPPLSNEHCIIIYEGVVYEVASLDFPGKGSPTGPYMRYGSDVEMTTSHYRGRQPGGCYNSLCDLSPGNLTVYTFPDSTEFITRSEKPGVQFIQIDFAEECWYYSHIDNIRQVNDWNSLEWNKIPGFPPLDLSIGKTDRTYVAGMSSYDILLDNTVIMRQSGGEFSALTINQGITNAPCRFDQFERGVLIKMKEKKVTLHDMVLNGEKQSGFWINCGYDSDIKASFEFAKMFEHLWRASTGPTVYIKCVSGSYAIVPRRYKGDDGKPLSIVVPRIHVYNMGLNGVLFPIVDAPDQDGYTIQNLDLTFDNFAALKAYSHEFKPGTYAVGESMTDWKFTEGSDYAYTCEGYTLPLFTNHSLVKEHYAKFESVCKQIRDNLFMSRMLDGTIDNCDNVIPDNTIDIVPSYELPLPEPEKPAVSGPVLPEEVKTAIDASIKAITNLSDLYTASQRSVESRIADLSKKAESLQSLIERMVSIEQKLRETE